MGIFGMLHVVVRFARLTRLRGEAGGGEDGEYGEEERSAFHSGRFLFIGLFLWAEVLVGIDAEDLSLGGFVDITVGQ